MSSSSSMPIRAVLKDADKFHLEYSLDKDEKDGAKRFDEIQDTLKAYGKLNKAGDFIVDMTMKDIKGVFQDALDNTFAQVLAKATKLPSFGAFTGTYADPFDNLMSVIQDKDKAAWEKVEKRKKDPEPFHSFSKTIDFYIKTCVAPRTRRIGVIANTHRKTFCI